MSYNFDKEINRENTNCVKYDLRNKVFNTKKEIIPMWVADMDLASPDFVKDAIIERANHDIYGYSYRPESYYNSITSWLKTWHNWEINPRSIAYSPGVVPGLALSVMAFSNVGDNIIVQPPVYFPFFFNNKRKRKASSL